MAAEGKLKQWAETTGGSHEPAGLAGNRPALSGPIGPNEKKGAGSEILFVSSYQSLLGGEDDRWSSFHQLKRKSHLP